MAAQSRQDLSTERAELLRFLQSETAKLAYTLCEKLCLGFINEAEDLFKRVIRRARNAIGKRGGSLEATVFRSLHQEWQRFADNKPLLSASSNTFSFEWNRADKRLAEDALVALAPTAREVFLFRFLLKLSESEIARLTGIAPNDVANRFHSAVEKVDPA